MDTVSVTSWNEFELLGSTYQVSILYIGFLFGKNSTFLVGSDIWEV